MRKEREASLWRRVLEALRVFVPFRVTLGITGLTISALLVAGLAASTIDRLTQSPCGMSCGYSLGKRSLPNFLDTMLVEFASIFGRIFGFRLHLDDLIVMIILGYVYVCALYGIIQLGFGDLLGTGYTLRIRKRRSFPQALSAAAVAVTLMMASQQELMIDYLPSYFSFVH